MPRPHDDSAFRVSFGAPPDNFPMGSWWTTPTAQQSREQFAIMVKNHATRMRHSKGALWASALVSEHIDQMRRKA